MRINPVLAAATAALAVYLWQRRRRINGGDSALPQQQEASDSMAKTIVAPAIAAVVAWVATGFYNDCQCPDGVADLNSDFESGLMDIEKIERLDVQNPTAPTVGGNQDVYTDIWQ